MAASYSHRQAVSGIARDAGSGDQVIVVYGDRFLIAERAKLGSLDDLSQFLHAGQPS